MKTLFAANRRFGTQTAVAVALAAFAAGFLAAPHIPSF